MRLAIILLLAFAQKLMLRDFVIMAIRENLLTSNSRAVMHGIALLSTKI